MSLMVLGTVALDNIKTHTGLKKDLLGGSATHFAMSAHLFTKVHMVGIIGHDFPIRHLKHLEKKGIDLTSVIVRKGKSFRWVGEYKKGDYNNAITLATELGVLLNYAPQVAAHQRDIQNIFLANIDPDIQMQLIKLMVKPKLIGLDSMNLWIHNKKKSLKRLMKHVNLFVANDREACDLSGEHNLIKAAKSLRKLGPEFIVVKKGEHGVLFYCDQFMFSFPAYPVEHVLDPTGAGDTFAGGLMGYLTKVGKINQKNLKKALLYATTMASYNVEGFGMDVTGKLTMSKVNQRMNKLMKYVAI